MQKVILPNREVPILNRYVDPTSSKYYLSGVQVRGVVHEKKFI